MTDPRDQAQAANLINDPVLQKVWSAVEESLVNALAVPRVPQQKSGVPQSEYDAQVLHIVNELNALRAVKRRLSDMAINVDEKRANLNKKEDD